MLQWDKSRWNEKDSKSIVRLKIDFRAVQDAEIEKRILLQNDT